MSRGQPLDEAAVLSATGPGSPAADDVAAPEHAMQLDRAGRWPAHLRSPLFRNGYILLVNAGATSGLGLLYWTLAARIYPVEVVGANSAAIAALSLLAALSRMELNATLVRYVPGAGRGTARLVLGSYAAVVALAICVGVAFIAGASSGVLHAGFMRAVGLSPLWFVPALAFWCIFNIQDSVLIGLRQVGWVPLENALFSAAKLLLLPALAGVLPLSGIFVSFTVPAALAVLPVNLLIFGWLLPRRAPEAGAEPFSLQRFARYSAGEYAGSLFGLTLVALPPLIVEGMLGSRSNAYFYVPWVVASAFSLFSSNMATSLTVEGALDEAQLAAYTRQVLRHVTRVIALAALALVLAAPYALAVLGHDYAVHGAGLLRLLAISEVPNSLVSLYFAVARVQRRTRDIALVQAGISAVFLTLLFTLLPVYGITGAGVAAVASQALAAALLLATRMRPLLWPRRAVTAA